MGWGGLSGEGMWEAGGGLYLQIGLYGVLTRSASQRQDKPRGPKRCSTNTEVNIRPIPPI